MSNSYKYIDEKSIYIDPKTGVLRNLLGIEDKETLNFVESAIVTKKLKELYESPIVISGVETLLLIHKLLFEEIYSWVGVVRTVEISKNGEQFFPTSYFEKGLTLNLNPIDDSSVYDRYMKGTIESNVAILTELIFELIDKTKD